MCARQVSATRSATPVSLHQSRKLDRNPRKVPLTPIRAKASGRPLEFIGLYCGTVDSDPQDPSLGSMFLCGPRSHQSFRQLWRVNGPEAFRPRLMDAGQALSWTAVQQAFAPL